MKHKSVYRCPQCKRLHPARSKAVECCSTGDELSPAELEAIGQRRLFDEGGAAGLIPEARTDWQE